ncbi:GspH/FimT family pseudopilin [Hydrogenophaga sp.]|uniref:GspH/FimT family pseudopilin n=1 Tax=Hydrogenophaga sp. TaxID=1904254 RepID=UPI003565F6E8
MSTSVGLRPLNRALTTGFSLIEVLVAVAVVAVLLSLAAPSFSSFFARYRVDTTREEMIASIQLARVEAIRQAKEVVLARSTANCSPALSGGATDWSCGWVVFTDLNENGVQDVATEPTIQTVAQPIGVAIANNNGSLVTMNRFGQFAGFGSFTFIPTSISSGTTTASQIICINAGSRIRTIKGAIACS